MITTTTNLFAVTLDRTKRLGSRLIALFYLIYIYNIDYLLSDGSSLS